MRRIPPLWPALLLSLALSSRASAAFRAAAGKADITPDLQNETVYLAGYGAKGRKPKGVHDPMHVRALVVSDGKKTVAMAAVDSIGLFREDVRDMRRRLGWEGGDKYLFVAATHDHAAPDTMGLWGPLPGFSGVDPRYQGRLKKAVVDLVRELEGRLQEAELVAAGGEIDPKGLCRDSRDPVVIDPELRTLQVRNKGGKPLGTVVRWSCHPEALGPGNRKFTADYPGQLCSRVEAETGAPCVFFSGTIGGLMTPDIDSSGGVDGELAESRRVGEALAAHALRLLKTQGEKIADTRLSFDSRIVKLPVENSRYLLFLRSLMFGHVLYQADGSELPRWKTFWLPLRHLVLFPLPERLRPVVNTEVSLVRIGPVKFLGVPGELFPELSIGGYDGSRRYGHDLTRPKSPNPPDLSRAPAGPYLREKLGAKHGFVVGLANDEIGYIIPEYDFQARPSRSMEPRMPGTHYEETNSIGRSAAPLLMKAFDELLGR